MNERYLQILLQLVKNRGNILRLVNAGLEHIKIAELIAWAGKENLIIKKNNSIQITPKGKERLKELNRINKSNWIKPEDKSRIEQIDINAIFVPRKDELDLD